ncbi:50S ribosomal protein L9 [Candidatus Peregrinibacteria bacterium RIFOXYC2_FULL_33_13]|nr:MAG: 50S ribosomal protein L9 [Candidatus Peregrinibacteria bacterium GW2011_GWA2_33_10]KKP39774.1 MAG: 50S ribosomal protein L9, large subunit ribosomal protein L9 [Candidatus Peregrinibacteria bacterium GW2011_GWC2_33_13]OGJ50359.1 MAG: 50S ribosomal protein L9 [Candidatus Peregrinibacteria bacterium RIFOXYA2_FULL_33_7]OGJ57057.1 MAG: 50S ribosomal protein L9 [Candidatus Peregrinibacteria bacterium RIFOXYC2_FULL_33_13]
MKVILKSDIKNLGKKFETKKVKRGYFVNFLFPRGYALSATPALEKEATKILNMKKKRSEVKEEHVQEIMDKLKDIQLVFKKNVSEHNRLFDSIAEKDILEALEAKGVSLKKENIRMKSHIKILGEHDVLIHLKEGAELNIKVNVEDEGK